MMKSLFEKARETYPVSLHCTKAFEMSNDGCHHTGYSCNRFEVDCSVQDFIGSNIIIVPTRAPVLPKYER